MLAPGIVDGTGVGEALGDMVGGGKVITQIFVILMILALFLAIMTAMAGSSRTLYQGSKDGWLPRYLTHVNEHGAPTRAMWTDLVFNLFLLALASDLVGLLLRARHLERRLHHLQLPQPQCRLDPSRGFWPHCQRPGRRQPG